MRAMVDDTPGGAVNLWPMIVSMDEMFGASIRAYPCKNITHSPNVGQQKQCFASFSDMHKHLEMTTFVELFY